MWRINGATRELNQISRLGFKPFGLCLVAKRYIHEHRYVVYESNKRVLKTGILTGVMISVLKCSHSMTRGGTINSGSSLLHFLFLVFLIIKWYKLELVQFVVMTDNPWMPQMSLLDLKWKQYALYFQSIRVNFLMNMDDQMILS